MTNVEVVNKDDTNSILGPNNLATEVIFELKIKGVSYLVTSILKKENMGLGGLDLETALVKFPFAIQKINNTINCDDRLDPVDETVIEFVEVVISLIGGNQANLNIGVINEGDSLDYEIKSIEKVTIH